MKWRMLLLISIAELFAMSLWFSATAVIPSLTEIWGLTNSGISWLTLSVQIGFVIGTLLSAIFNISDIFDARYVVAVSVFAGSILNGMIGLVDLSVEMCMFMRFLTGITLAGVYPPGMKLISGWFKKQRGVALGVLIGALTLGTASPYFVKSIGNPGWQAVILSSSVLGIAGGIVILFFVKNGPHLAVKSRFNWKFVSEIFKNRNVRNANFGYLGHMWELYAFWAWIPAFLLASFSISGISDPDYYAGLGTFIIISSGFAGSTIAGILADKYGRAEITIWAMSLSGLCCLFAGFLFGGSPILLFLFCIIWGITVVADSAQFSAAVTELADPEYTGTALTIQTCLGFLITMISIRILPVLHDLLTWKYAFMILAAGPVFGITAMLKLQNALNK